MWAVLSVVINTYALLFLHIFIKTHITLSLYLKKKLYIYPAYYVVFLFLCIIIRHVCHIEFSFFNIIFFLLRLSKKKQRIASMWASLWVPVGWFCERTGSKNSPAFKYLQIPKCLKRGDTGITGVMSVWWYVIKAAAAAADGRVVTYCT